MNRDQAITALDKAFEDRISALFGFFSSNEATESPDTAERQFSAGFSLALDAYGRARAVIESKLPK